ncbi:MAG: nitrilase-related carbon-nitrogen hydrolase [Pseudomonadota bacterium]
MEDIRIAAVVMESVVGKTSGNLMQIESFVRKAARRGVRLICFPEASITGYSVRERISAYAEPIPGPSAEALVRLSKSTGLTILSGLIERGESGTLFISHIVTSPRGLEGVYRKLHLAPNEEKIYKHGNGLPTYGYGKVTFGIELCYDTHFPELTTLLALRGVEVVFLPYASPRETSTEKRERWLGYLSARAYDNSIFVVACNQVGHYDGGGSFPGVALILGPKGQTMAEMWGDDEGIITADLRAKDLAEVRGSKMGFFLSRRRPEIYGELSISPMARSDSRTASADLTARPLNYQLKLV